MAELALRNGGVTLVDDADYERLAQYSWAGYVMDANGNRYAMTDVPEGRLYMHRLIVSARDGFEADHRNGDTLDNRRENLREVTHAQNQQNRRCGYGVTGIRNVGVTPGGRFLVRLQVEGKTLSFGCYDTVEEAAFVARQARLKHFPFSHEPELPTPPNLLDWHPCPNAPGYFVTRDGRVRNSHGEELSQRRAPGGSLYVAVFINRKRHTWTVARLLKATFD